MGFLKVLSSQKIVCMQIINYLLSSTKYNFVFFFSFLKAYLVSFSKNFFLGLSRNSMVPPEVGQANKEMVLGYLFCHGS